MVALPVLDTERLSLVAPSDSHAADVFDYGRDPEFCAFIAAKPFKMIGEAQSFLRALDADNAEGRRAYWVATTKDRGRAIGTMGFNFLFPESSGVVDFGYGIGRSYWGSGLFQEAAVAILRHGFEVRRFARIQATTRADNPRSIRGVEKLGFRREATLRSFYAIDGGRADAVVLAILAQEWKSSH